MRIVKTNTGIASRVEDTIYMNKMLDRYPKLKRAILEHENNHTDGFTMKDVLLDIRMDELKGLKSEYYKFILQNPSSWIEFLPIKKYGDVVLFNLPVFLIWLFFGGLLCFVLYGVFS